MSFSVSAGMGSLGNSGIPFFATHLSDHGNTLSIDFEISGKFLANKGIHKYRIGK